MADRLKVLLQHPVAWLAGLAGLVIFSTFLVDGGIEIERLPSPTPLPVAGTPTVDPSADWFVVALKPITRHSRITADDIDLRFFHFDGPPGALRTPTEAVGRLARVEIVQGQPLFGWMLTNPQAWAASAVPAQSSGHIFYTERARLLAIEAQSGRPSWQFEPEGLDNYGSPLASPPVAADEQVYYTATWRDQSLAMGAYQNALFALEAASGRLIWQSIEVLADTNPALPAPPPVITAKTIYLVTWDYRTLLALDRASGRPRWRFSPGDFLAPPAAGEELVVVTTNRADLYGLDPATGQIRWRIRRQPLIERQSGN